MTRQFLNFEWLISDDIWPNGPPDATEAPSSNIIGTIAFSILGVILGFFFILDAFSVIKHLRYARQNISDFTRECLILCTRRKLAP